MFGSWSKRSRAFHRRAISLATAAGLTLLVSPAVTLLTEGSAHAASDPVGVSFTLEGCNNDGTVSLPNSSGDFVCPDADYTTGNLGKGWSELDLVPHRITSAAGNSAPSSQQFAVVIAADNLDTGSAGQEPGYDVISVPVLNTSLSTGLQTDPSNCAITASSATTQTPGQGGIDSTIYRILTINQDQNTTCVFDYYERLALGSHLFPGSALHSNLLNQDLTTAGIGSKEVSIPVKEIAPQELSKDMTATQGATYNWTLSKSADPTSLAFGSTCGATTNAPKSKSVTVTVNWTRSAQQPNGDITLTTHVTATNPASRAITVSVEDKMYAGSTQTTLLNTGSGTADVAGGTSHTFTFTATATSGTTFNDVATATYTDDVTGVAVPGTTTASASADVTSSGSVTNASAVLTDTESISGTGFSYSIDSVTPSGDSPTTGNAFTSYTLGTKTTSDVAWTSASIAPSGTGAASGSFAFAETVYVATPGNYTGTLSDTAHLKNGSTDLDDPATASTSLSATADNPTVTVHKTVDIAPASDATFYFTVTNRDTGAVVSNVPVTIKAGDLSGSSSAVTVAPSTTGYVVHETSAPSEYTVSGDVTDTRPLALCGSETINMTDSRNMGTITVDKSRVGDPAGAGTTFTFDVDCPGDTYDQTLTIDLASKTSDTATTGQIPTGTACTVTEGDHAGWTVTPSASQSATVGDTVSFTNTRNTGTITVDKSLVGDPTGAGTTFTFGVDCPGDTYDQTLTIDLASKTSGSATTGQIPTSLTCTVTEGDHSGWTVTPSASQSATVGDTVAFTNTRNTGVITIDKSLVGDSTGAATSFGFHVDCPGTAYDEDLVLDLTGATSGSTTTDAIPTGLVCTVTEGSSPGWTVSVDPANGQATVPGTVAFTNTRDTGVITVTKATSGAVAGASTVFTFDVVCPQNSAYDQTLTIDTSSASSVTSTDIPTGLVCSVVEESTAGWQQTTPAQGGVDVTVPGTAAFTNTRLTGPLQLSKAVTPPTGSYTAGDPNNTLTYTLSLSPTGALDHTNVVVTDYIPGYDPADTASGKTTYVDGSATCSTGCTATYDATQHLLSWAVGNVNHDDAAVVMTFKVTIDAPNFDPTVGLPTETIDNIGFVESLQQSKTPSNQVKTPVTAVLGIKVVKPKAEKKTLPFTGLPIPAGVALWSSLLMIGIGGVLTSVRRRRKA